MTLETVKITSIIIIIIIINTFEHTNFIKKLLMESPLRRRIMEHVEIRTVIISSARKNLNFVDLIAKINRTKITGFTVISKSLLWRH